MVYGTTHFSQSSSNDGARRALSLNASCSMKSCDDLFSTFCFCDAVRALTMILDMPTASFDRNFADLMLGRHGQSRIDGLES